MATEATIEPEVQEPEEESGRRMPDDLKTIGAILRLLKSHDDEEQNEIMEYVVRRTRRLIREDAVRYTLGQAAHTATTAAELFNQKR